jgi:hypothetical protein
VRTWNWGCLLALLFNALAWVVILKMAREVLARD